MSAKITRTESGIEIYTPYNAAFVDALKALPREVREWRGDRKAWFVAASHAEEATGIAVRFYPELNPDLSVDEAEEAAIDAEAAKIAASQRWIVENKERIEREIARLSENIRGYSIGSKSRVKYNLARERALLQNALEAATQPVESLPEISVRGLVAARRHMES